MSPFFTKNGKRTIVVNEQALEKGDIGVTVAAHEFLHKALFNILKKNPSMQLAFGHALHKYIMTIQGDQVRNSDFRNRLLLYHDNYG